MSDQMPPVRPLLPQMRKTSSVIAEYLGTILIPVFFIGVVITTRYSFAGPDWECSGDGCLEEFDRLRGWTFPVPLFLLDFLCSFGLVGAILLRLWGRSGRPATFEPKEAAAIPALRGVGRNLMWVGLLVIGMGGASAWAGQWLSGGILLLVGVVLILYAWSVAAKTERSDRILRTGESAIGELTELERTGMTLNDNPEFKLTLTIHRDGVPVYPVVHKEFVPQFHSDRVQVGARLPVKVDPLDQNNVVIEWDRAPQPAQPASQA